MSQKRNIKPRFWLCMMAALVVVFFSVYLSQNDYMLRQTEHVALLKRQRDQQYLTNSELDRKIEFTKTDEYIERVAREELGLVMPGQVRYVVPMQ